MGLAPQVIAAGVGAVGNLLGGLLGKSKNKYVIPPYQKIRDAAEAAGIHPMFALSAAPGQVVQTGGIPGLGQAFGDAASALAGAINQPKSQQAQAVNERLVSDNQRLSRQLTRFTLRPPQPGLFERSTLDGQTERAPDVSPAGRLAFSANLGLPPADSVTGRDRVAFHDGVSIWGNHLNPVPGFDDAETAQARYGDGVEFVAGIGNYVADNVADLAADIRPNAAEIADSRMLYGPDRVPSHGSGRQHQNRGIMSSAQRDAARNMFQMVPPSGDATFYSNAAAVYRALHRRRPARAF
jgi:hypothetical protein